MYQRFAADLIRTALADTRVVLVVGPRQAGKTTLVREITEGGRAYFTLDDAGTLAAAREDPVGFVRGIDRSTIDEVQRAPELLIAIKKSVDEDRRPGRFLLAGSSNLMAIPDVADSLAGRMETIQLLPLSQSELRGAKPSFLDSIFSGAPPFGAQAPIWGDSLIEIVLAGGYPEALMRATPDRRVAWYRAYVDAIVQRDVRDIAEVGRLGDMPRLLALLAEVTGQLVNYTHLAGPLGLDRKTGQRYLDIFSALYLTRLVPPWHSNQIARLTKTPKLHFLDTGLVAAMRGMTLETLRADRTKFGHLLETYIFGELLKQAGWMPEKGIAIYHFRTTTRTAYEVDFVLENQMGAIVGIEVKASATVRANDFSGVRKLAEVTQTRFAAGIVLYDGEAVLPFGEKLFAVPLSAVWQ